MKTYDGLMKECADYHTKNQLAIGYLRYEAVRKLSPEAFRRLCQHNVATGEPFDGLVDELVLK